ncbi:MAG: enoyl-CoA hydratase [Polyangiales bacterium]
MSEHIETRVEKGVLEILFRRPKTKNSFLVTMYAAVSDALRNADADPTVRVIVLRGEGGNFSSGNDLQDFLDNPPSGPDSITFQFMQTMRATKKPIVAAVDGVVVGIGSTMLFQCDLVYAADNAKFILPFVNLATVPECGASFLLPLMAGIPKASELFFFGEPFDAATADRVGLVTRVLPADELHAYVTNRAQKLAAQPSESLQRTKMLLKKANDAALAAHMDEEATHFCELMRAAPCREAIAAFFEKRAPNFAQFES